MHRRTAALAALVASASLALLAACASRPPKAIELPAVASLEGASELLLERVEVDDEPPDWLDHDRISKGHVYGIGIQSDRRRPAEDLYQAMYSARRTIVVWIESRGAVADEPGSLLPPVRVDPERIEFERLARDKKANRWYALARLDIERERQLIRAEVETIEKRMEAAVDRLDDDDAPTAVRTRAALGLRYDLVRRDQYDRLHVALTGEALERDEDLDDAELGALADEVLGAHGVRIQIEGSDVHGLKEAIGAALGEVGLRNDEFGQGLVSVRLFESDAAFGPDNPYLEIEGTVETALLGGNEPPATRPLRVVRTGASLAEARFGAAREINADVAQIVRESLREIGAPGS
jgi:hypothetical protein